MEDWKLESARDLNLSGMDRYTSPHREGGLVESTARLFWWLGLRGLFQTWNGLRVIGRENLPTNSPFVMVANHSSHLDVLLLTAALPLRWRDLTIPIAARDVFFETLPVAAFAATFINAFPINRKVASGRALVELRQRIQNESCIFVLFPEGTRARDGVMAPFKPGIGMLVAGAPVPVVPCHIEGAFTALPPDGWWLRPYRLTVRVGQPQVFADLPNKREGWETCAERLQQHVTALGEKRTAPA
jgi:1-acyl-sn-glycerol-3-phosphate acyltransferase